MNCDQAINWALQHAKIEDRCWKPFCKLWASGADAFRRADRAARWAVPKAERMKMNRLAAVRFQMGVHRQADACANLAITLNREFPGATYCLGPYGECLEVKLPGIRKTFKFTA